MLELSHGPFEFRNDPIPNLVVVCKQDLLLVAAYLQQFVELILWFDGHTSICLSFFGVQKLDGPGRVIIVAPVGMVLQALWAEIRLALEAIDLVPLLVNLANWQVIPFVQGLQSMCSGHIFLSRPINALEMALS